MALAFQVDSLDGVEESQRGFYEEKDGKFVLAVEGLPQEDLEGLKKNRDDVLSENVILKKKQKEHEESIKAAKDAAEAARLEAAQKSGDTESLNKSWREKFTNRESELLAIIEAKDSTITSVTSGHVAAQIAGDLALDLGNGETTADTLQKLIKSHLKTEFKDGVPRTVVLDAQGQPTAQTVDEFKKEFASRPSILPLIAGSKASGGGANGSNGGGAANDKTTTRSQFDQMGASEKMAFMKSGGSISDD